MALDDLRTIHDLNDYWDDLAAGEAPLADDLDPALAATVRQLHALDTVPGPDRAFAERLRRDLLARPEAPATPVARVANRRLHPSLPLPRPAWADRPAPRPAPAARRAWAALAVGANRVASVALILILSGAIALVLGNAAAGGRPATPPRTGATAPAAAATVAPPPTPFDAAPTKAPAPALATAPTAAPPAAPPAPVWQPVAPLSVPREGHTASPLDDGQVLVAGGISVTRREGLATAERFDPAAGRWLPAAAMHQTRVNHTPTRLRDGRILVTGGFDSRDEGQTLASGEIYDPAADRWTPIAPMGEARMGHTASLLPDGRVLVAGGYRNRPAQAILATAEIYDPRTNSWTPAPALAVARAGQTSTPLQDGQILLTGGSGADGQPLASAERYDPRAGRWFPAGGMTRPRSLHSATLLPDGGVLVAGNAAADATTERYDPAANAWRPAGALADRHSLHTATPLPDGTVLVVAGCAEGDRPAATVERYDPATDRWSAAPPLTAARCNQTATLLPDGRLLIVGGKDTNGPLRTAEILPAQPSPDTGD